MISFDAQELDPLIKAAANQAGISRSEWLRAACQAFLEKPEGVLPEILIPPVASSLTAQAQSIAAQTPDICTHPKEQWQHLSWGTVCGLCKIKIR